MLRHPGVAFPLAISSPETLREWLFMGGLIGWLVACIAVSLIVRVTELRRRPESLVAEHRSFDSELPQSRLWRTVAYALIGTAMLAYPLVLVALMGLLWLFT